MEEMMADPPILDYDITSEQLDYVLHGIASLLVAHGVEPREKKGRGSGFWLEAITPKRPRRFSDYQLRDDVICLKLYTPKNMNAYHFSRLVSFFSTVIALNEFFRNSEFPYPGFNTRVDFGISIPVEREGNTMSIGFDMETDEHAWVLQSKCSEPEKYMQEFLEWREVEHNEWFAQLGLQVPDGIWEDEG